jgi:hypothetical protein
MLLALGGCNQNKDSSSAAAAPAASTKSSASASKELDACTLVTKAEAEAVLGEHIKDRTSGPASMHGGSICMYESADSLSARHITIRVESPNFDWNKYKEQMRVEGENMRPKPGRVRQVSGLGRDAYFARHVLHVLTDKGTLTVIVFKDPGEAVAGEETETKAESAEKTLAEKAVTRL